MEDIRNDERLQIAQNLINAGKLSHEEIASATGLSLETIKELAGEKAS